MVSIIDRLAQNFLKLRKYNITKSEKAYEACMYIRENGINVKNIYMLESVSNDLLNHTPTYEYEIQIEITEQIVSLMKFWYADKTYTKDDYDFIVQYFFILENYCNLSNFLAMLGIYGAAWDYLMESICPIYKELDTELEEYSIYLIWEQGIEKLPEARNLIINICSCYFYLSRILGHNYQDCIELFESTKRWIKIGITGTNTDIRYLCFAYSLLNLHKYQSVEEIRNILISQYDIEILRDKESAFQICYTLHSGYTDSNEMQLLWATKGIRILDDLGSTNKESRIVLELSILLNNQNFEKVKIKNKIIEYLKYLEDVIPNLTLRGFQKQKMSEIINKCILHSIEKNEYDFIAECVYIWRTYPDNTPFSSNDIMLLVLSNLKIDMIVYLVYYNDKSILFEFPKLITMDKLIKSKNQFEGNWTVIQGEESCENFNSSGYPNKRFSNCYYENLGLFYRTDKIVKELNLIEDINEIKIIELPWTNTPIEAMLGMQWDKSLSLIVSGNTKPKRIVKKVLIWCDPDGSLPSTIIEKELVQRNLISGEGVNVDVFIDEECSFDLFCEKYKDESYDVIWLMCHGSFDFDNPSNSYLYISKDKPIAINELVDLTPQSDQSRLLVINACQSGCSSIRSSGINFVGFGSSLSSKFQSIIGHLWPIDSFAAAIFGAILSYNLLKYEEWGKAINVTRQKIIEGNKAIEDFFKYTLKYEEDSEILQRLNRCSDDMNEIIFWGSAALFK